MTIKIPDKFMGVPLEGAIERYLAKDNIPAQAFTPVSPINNPRSYLILPGKTNGDYLYPDLNVEITRLGYDNEVENAAKKLGLTLKNTQKENNKKEFIGNIKWENALKLNLTLNSLTLNLRQFLDFIALLKSGRAFYADGTPADKKIIDNLLDEILTIRSPYRAEWFDADFKVKNNKLYINYAHKLINGNLTPQKSELLEEYLTDDKQIDLDDLLINSTKQGLPKKNVKNGSLSYFASDNDNNSVAGFFANSGRFNLSCDGDPQNSKFITNEIGWLGMVYAAKIIKCILTLIYIIKFILMKIC